MWMSYQENQDSSGNRKNVIQGQRPDMVKHDKERKATKIIHIK